MSLRSLASTSRPIDPTIATMDDLLAARDPRLATIFRQALPVATAEIARRLRVARDREDFVDELPAALTAEITESARNLAFAMTGFADRRHRLGAELSTAQWLAHARLDRAFSALAFFEQCVVDGHRLHPMARIRTGMTAAEILAYAPEWTDEISLPLVAVHRDDLRDRGFTALLVREHPAAVGVARKELTTIGVEPADYALVTVHPWQAQRVLGTLFAAALRHRRLVITSARVPARPLLGLRTVAPIGGGSHLKTAIGIRLTSAIRGIPVASAAAAPVVSNALTSIVARENGFGCRFQALSEYATASRIPADGSTAARRAATMLGAVARHNPEALLDGPADDTVLLPVAALRADSPITGRPILADLFGANNPHVARTFVCQYAAVALPPLLTLLTRYGIALEAHAQNTLLAVAGLAGVAGSVGQAGAPSAARAVPVAIFVRDFGNAVRVRHHRLAAHHLELPIDPTAPINARDDADLRGWLAYAVVFDQLGGVISRLATLSGVAEQELWRPFAQVARRTFANIGACCADCQRWATEDSALFLGPQLPYKAHLRMRLTEAGSDTSYVTAANPLHGLA